MGPPSEQASPLELGGLGEPNPSPSGLPNLLSRGEPRSDPRSATLPPFSLPSGVPRMKSKIATASNERTRAMPTVESTISCLLSMRLDSSRCRACRIFPEASHRKDRPRPEHGADLVIVCGLVVEVKVPSSRILQIRGRVAPGGLLPRAPTDQYVPFRAYGSSHHEFAAGRYTEWIATGGGSGYRPNSR